MSRVPVILVVLSLAGCTSWGAGPDIGGATQDSVTIRYDATKVEVGKVDDVARSYCGKRDREAKLRNRFADSPDMSYAVFSCVRPGG